jgi:hypothetical protein
VEGHDMLGNGQRVCDSAPAQCRCWRSRSVEVQSRRPLAPTSDRRRQPSDAGREPAPPRWRCGAERGHEVRLGLPRRIGRGPPPVLDEHLGAADAPLRAGSAHVASMARTCSSRTRASGRRSGALPDSPMEPGKEVSPRTRPAVRAKAQLVGCPRACSTAFGE